MLLKKKQIIPSTIPSIRFSNVTKTCGACKSQLTTAMRVQLDSKVIFDSVFFLDSCLLSIYIVFFLFVLLLLFPLKIVIVVSLINNISFYVKKQKALTTAILYT